MMIMIPEILEVFSRSIKMISDRKPGWEPMLPLYAEIIKEHSLFWIQSTFENFERKW
jgi:hypothetical protein